MKKINYDSMAAQLIKMYDSGFGGKEAGRYRISLKHLKAMCGRRRISSKEIEKLKRHIYELGFVLVDLENFYILLSQKTFTNYRRINDEIISSILIDSE